MRKFVISLLCTSLLVTPLMAQDSAAKQPSPRVLEETFPFPPPIQWKLTKVNPEISVVGIAWGPANSPEMIAKGGEVRGQGAASFLPDRPYALAICLRVVSPKPTQPLTLELSGLVRVKDVEGNIEYPSALMPTGFAPLFVIPAGVNDIPMKGNETVEHWDFFPVSPDQKEFLFQVFPPSNSPIVSLSSPRSAPTISFRVIVKDNKFAVVNVSTGTEATSVRFTRSFTGTIGAQSAVNVQLTANGPELSGTEQYVRIGKTLWLRGAVDSLGNFQLKEYYPKDELTGIFDGKFSENYGEMTGYFSKPDGSRLQPFEFRAVAASTQNSQ